MENIGIGIELLDGIHPDLVEMFNYRFRRVNGSHYISKFPVGRKNRMVDVMRVKRGEDVWNIYCGGEMELEKGDRHDVMCWLFDGMGV